MNITRILTGAAKIRTIMLAYYAGVATGCFLMVAASWMIVFATPQAMAVIEWLQ